MSSATRKLDAKSKQQAQPSPSRRRQSVAATTATTYDAISLEMKRWRWIPEIRYINQYHDEPRYIEALAKTVKAHWAEHGQQEKLMMSFHGLPKRNLELGDPYHCQCHKTGRLLAEALGLTSEQWLVTFQSRFGKAEWLKPYTDKTLEKLAKEGAESGLTQSTGTICLLY